jgi:hypothetical protein
MRLAKALCQVYIIISVDTRVFAVHRMSQKTLKPGNYFYTYPINIFVIGSRCKYNLVEKVFATYVIKM